MAARFMVISFQRSGLNWLRYCTEYFTGMRTPGRPQIIAEGSGFFIARMTSGESRNGAISPVCITADRGGGL